MGASALRERQRAFFFAAAERELELFDADALATDLLDELELFLALALELLELEVLDDTLPE